MKSITLQTGRSIPLLGMGTWQIQGDPCAKAVGEALAMGYTHIDTADGYSNHKEVGKGIKESGKSRDSFFLTTKVAKHKQKTSDVLRFGEQMLQDLQVDYVDLLLIHWPTRSVPLDEPLAAMKELVDKGYVRDIGISNFNKELCSKTVELSEIPVVMNQVEFHPLLFQKDLQEHCRSLKMDITAYSPLAQGKVMEHPVIQEIAASKNISAAQVSLAWIMSKGIVVIPKASSAGHLESNLKAAEISLTGDEISAIDQIKETIRIVEADGWREYDF